MAWTALWVLFGTTDREHAEAEVSRASAVQSQSTKALEDLLHPIQVALDEGHYEEAERLARQRLTEIEREKGPDSLEAAKVLHLLVDALWRSVKVSGPEAEELAERNLKIRTSIFGAESPEAVGALIQLANVFSARSEYAKTKESLERAISIQEKSLKPGDPAIGITLNNLGNVLSNMSDFSGAQRALERALKTYETARGPEDTSVAEVLENLADAQSELGNSVAARSNYERALSIFEKQLGPDHPNVADCLNAFAYLLWENGDYDAARPLYARALRIREKTFGSNSPKVATTLVNSGILAGSNGQLKEAISLFERALSITESALGSDHLTVGIVLENAAVSYKLTGDYRRAEQAHERALGIFEKRLGTNHTRVGWVLTNVGSLKYTLGDYEGARRSYERAVAIFEKAAPDSAMNQGPLEGLGEVDEMSGRYEDAQRYFERALSVAEKSGVEHPDAATILCDLGDLSLLRNRFDEAQKYYERALAIDTKAFGPEHSSVATSLIGVADALTGLGKYGEALADYRRAISIQENALGPEHPDTGKSFAKLAKLMLRTGDRNAALEASLRAERIALRHVRLAARSLPERDALSYEATRASGLDIALTVALSDFKTDSTASAVDAVVRSRAVVLDEMAKRHRAAVTAKDPALAELEQRLVAARDRFAMLAVKGFDDANLARSRKRLDDAREDEEQAERALAEKSIIFRRDLETEEAGLKDVAAGLPASSALVSFLRYERMEQLSSALDGVSSLRSIPSYAAFVLRPATAPVLVPIATAADVEATVLQLRHLIGEVPKAEGRSPKALEAAYRQEGGILRKQVWDPVARYLEGAKIVFVVPDGALNLINFDTLPTGSREYLLERPQVLHYLSSERDLLDQTTAPMGVGLFAIANPEFDTTGPHRDAPIAENTKPQAPAPDTIADATPYRGIHSSCADFRSLRFEPLPDSSKEMDEIAKTWEEGMARSTDSGSESSGTTVSRLEGTEATEAAFKKHAPGHDILHVATHGFFLAGSCAPPVAAAEGTGSGNPRGIPAGESPLLLSGLALAGANRREVASPGEDDGILTAEEVASIDLTGTDWAVLSACDTGLGTIVPGEGVFGLRRAFHVAGVRTLIMSLWQVEDQSSERWMRGLYEGRFVKGLSTSEAVREASLSVLLERRRAGKSTHPFYWGGFVAEGAWR